MVKKVFKFLLWSFSGIIVCIVLFIIWAIRNPIPPDCSPPDKPADVPADAIWNGCDGGFWLEFVSDSCNHFRFRVYTDWGGELFMDAFFTPKQGDIILMNKDNWKGFNPIYYPMELDDYISIGDSINRTFLKIIYPANGGSSWEIVKEKYNFAYDQFVR